MAGAAELRRRGVRAAAEAGAAGSDRASLLAHGRLAGRYTGPGGMPLSARVQVSFRAFAFESSEAKSVAGVAAGGDALQDRVAECRLASTGLSIVVTFDLRGAGRSTGHASFTGEPEVADVMAVCRWAGEKYAQRILLLGSSA
ncbi:unnamed protein product, partial [Closterium sp. NIES-65]